MAEGGGRCVLRAQGGGSYLVSRPDLTTLTTRDRYLAVATYLTSRAFPSALLRLPNGETKTSSSETETEVGAEAESHPVLLPGLDMLNRASSPVLAD